MDSLYRYNGLLTKIPKSFSPLYLFSTVLLAGPLSPARQVCECDKTLINFLVNADNINTNFDANDCEAGNKNINNTRNNKKCSGGQAETACCNWGYMNAIYNVASQCCDSSAGVKDIGTC